MTREPIGRPGVIPGKLPPPAILIVLRSLEVGGSQQQAILLAGELRDTWGARVAIWTLERGGPLEGALAAAKIPWENHPALIDRQGLRKVPGLFALIRAIRKWQPDAILPFNDFPNKACGAIWPCTGAKICIWNQRDEGREVTGRFLERLALRRVRVFAANSSQGAGFLKERFGIPGSRIHIVPNCVQLAPRKQTREEWRAALGLTGAAIIVTMVANLHRYKDHQTLLEAWAMVKELDEDDVHLILAGRPGDTAEPLANLCRRLHIEASVHFIGLTDDVTGLLGASDTAVFSSQLEGMPNGVLEGMAAGLPVVATRIAGTEAALGTDYPLLVPPGDAQALAGALRALISDGALRRQLGERNQKRARIEFSAAHLGQRYMDILHPYLQSSHEQL